MLPSRTLTIGRDASVPLPVPLTSPLHPAHRRSELFVANEINDAFLGMEQVKHSALSSLPPLLSALDVTVPRQAPATLSSPPMPILPEEGGRISSIPMPILDSEEGKLHSPPMPVMASEEGKVVRPPVPVLPGRDGEPDRISATSSMQQGPVRPAHSIASPAAPPPTADIDRGTSATTPVVVVEDSIGDGGDAADPMETAPPKGAQALMGAGFGHVGADPGRRGDGGPMDGLISAILQAASGWSINSNEERDAKDERHQLGLSRSYDVGRGRAPDASGDGEGGGPSSDVKFKRSDWTAGGVAQGGGTAGNRTNLGELGRPGPLHGAGKEESGKDGTGKGGTRGGAQKVLGAVEEIWMGRGERGGACATESTALEGLAEGGQRRGGDVEVSAPREGREAAREVGRGAVSLMHPSDSADRPTAGEAIQIGDGSGEGIESIWGSAGGASGRERGALADGASESRDVRHTDGSVTSSTLLSQHAALLRRGPFSAAESEEILVSWGTGQAGARASGDEDIISAGRMTRRCLPRTSPTASPIAAITWQADATYLAAVCRRPTWSSWRANWRP